MVHQNIQRRENQAIRRTFDAAGDPRKVMVVGLDLAERQHRAAVCNGQGDLLCAPWWVHNDRAGLALLEARIGGLGREHRIDGDHVVIGAESPGSWAVNFADCLVEAGHLVIELHARDVQRRRENATTDNDTLSALTICRCLIDKEGRERPPPGLYGELRIVVRPDAKLVQALTRVKNQIHSSADICWSGVLDPELPGLCWFCEPMLWQLEHSSLPAVQRLHCGTLARQLQKQGAADAEALAAELKSRADRALPCSGVRLRTETDRLGCLVAQYRLLSAQEKATADRAACLLRQTPGALLTSLKGIGVRLAFQLVAELGDPARIDSVDRKVNYFGLTERTHATGGENAPVKRRGRQRRCNRFGKKAILSISDSVHRCGWPEFREYRTQRELAGHNGRHALGRKLLGLAVAIMRKPHAYVPRAVFQEPPDSPLRRICYRELAEVLHGKWRAFALRPEAQDDQLRQWEEMVNSLYNLDVSV
jgi:transposase